MDFLNYIKENSTILLNKIPSSTTTKPKILPKPKIFNGKVAAVPMSKLMNDDLIDFTAELVVDESTFEVDWQMDKKKPINKNQVEIIDCCKQVFDALKNVLLMNSGLFFFKLFL